MLTRDYARSPGNRHGETLLTCVLAAGPDARLSCLGPLKANPHRRNSLTNGLILLGLIAVLIAFGVTRVRRRTGLAVTAGTWGAVIAFVAIVVLLMYAYSNRH